MKLKIMTSTLLVVCCFLALTASAEDQMMTKKSAMFPNFNEMTVKALQLNIPDDTNQDDTLSVLSDIRAIRKSVDDFTEVWASIQTCRELDVIQEEYNLTSPCYDNMMKWCRDFSKSLRGERYAFQMLDSWGTPEYGYLEGNIRWPGRYYECLKAGKINDAENEKMETKWCNAYYGIQYWPTTLGYSTDAQLGVCFPETCSEQEISDMLVHFYGKQSIKPIIFDHKPLHVNCPEPQTDMDTPSLIFAIILGLLTVLLITGSLYDIHLRMKGEKNQGKSTMGQILLSFSAITNTENVLETSRPPGYIPCLDGIRCLSTSWVILFHCQFFPNYGYDNSVVAKEESTTNGAFLALVNGTYAVDTFFVLSGLLVTYFGLKQLTKSGGKMNILLMYLQRYLRLTPAYAFLILFSIGFYKFFGYGPYWEGLMTNMKGWCETNWWANLVYINNLYPAENYCYAWGWYLADDMQFYLMSPFIVWILYKNRYAGVGLIFSLMLGSIITCGVLTEEYHIQPHPLTFNFLMYTPIGHMAQPNKPVTTFEMKYKHDVYFAPWVRMHAYMIGMLTGYLLFATKLKLKINKILASALWLVATGCGAAVVYGIYHYISTTGFMDTNISAFYNAMARPTFAMCVSWVIVACITGNAGPIPRLLNWTLWTPISKLTYTVYLVHVLVIYWYMGVQESPMHFSYVHYVYFYFGTLMISLAMAYVVSLLVEWPMIGLLRVAFPKPKPQIKKNKEEEEEGSDPPSYSWKENESFEENEVVKDSKL